VRVRGIGVSDEGPGGSGAGHGRMKFGLRRLAYTPAFWSPRFRTNFPGRLGHLDRMLPRAMPKNQESDAPFPDATRADLDAEPSLLLNALFSCSYPDTANTEAIRQLFSISYRDSGNRAEKR